MAKSKRTRTGCLCCRRRHKKCDEQRPTCKFCYSKGLVCEWPVKGSVFVNYNRDQPQQLVHPQDQPKISNQPQFSHSQLSSSPKAQPIPQRQVYANFTALGFAGNSPSPKTFPRSPQSRTPSIANPMMVPQATNKNYDFSYSGKPQFTNKNYDFSYSGNTLINLPPMKQYHFMPRAALEPLIPQQKRLSVDSLLN